MNKSKPNLTLADIEWLESEFLPDLAMAVQKGLEKKLDRIDTNLDKLVGEVKGYREEQTVNSDKLSNHGEQLENHETRINRIEKRINLQT